MSLKGCQLSAELIRCFFNSVLWCLIKFHRGSSCSPLHAGVPQRVTQAWGRFYQDGSHLRPRLLPPSGQHHGPDGAYGLQGQRLQLSRPVRDPRLQLQRNLWQGHQEGEFTPLHFLRAEMEESPAPDVVCRRRRRRWIEKSFLCRDSTKQSRCQANVHEWLGSVLFGICVCLRWCLNNI